MKTPTIPTLLGPDGMTSLREYAGYHGGGSGFGGQLRAWNPPSESVDAALLPNFTRGNARADDLVRNNGYAANAIQLHQDHIVGSFFRLSHRPSWRYLGSQRHPAASGSYRRVFFPAQSSPKLALSGHRGGRSPCLFPRG